MIAFITSVQKVNNKFLYTAVGAHKKIFVLAKEIVEPGDYVDVSGVEKEGVVEGKIKSIDKRVFAEDIKKIEAFIDKSCPLRTAKPFDAFVAKMSNKIDGVARALARAAFLGRPIIVRFHSDTDGVCSALALYYALGAKIARALPQRTPLYTRQDFEEDRRAMPAGRLPPLLVCLDFGSSSAEGYRLAKRQRWQIAIIDHHPTLRRPNTDLIINPHLHGGDSDYATGILAAEVARRLSDANLRNVDKIAAIGDRSKFASDDKKLSATALALDYYVGIARFPQRIEEFAKVLEDEELIQVANIQAHEKLTSIVQRLIAKARQKQIGQFKVVTFCTDKEFVDGEYPSRGEMAGGVCDAFRKEEKIIVIGWGKRAFNLRATPAAVAAGLDCNSLVQAVAGAVPIAIEAGGGHKGAAGIRIKKGLANIVLAQLLKEIEKLETK